MTKEELTKWATNKFPDPKIEDYDDILEYRNDRNWMIVARNAVLEGYEQAEKDLGWHSVHESLPEIDKEMIVLTNRVRDIELDSANRICFAHIVDRSLAMDWDGWNIPGVKFWMPCHKLPDEK